MKSLLNSSIFITIAFLSFSTWAANNPQIRECRIRGGEFTSVDTGSDQIGLCHLGSAYIGSLDLMLVVNQEGLPKSVEMYANEMKKCDPLGTSKNVPTLEGQELSLCFFDDGSVIGMSTLHNGRYSAENSQLNQALGL